MPAISLPLLSACTGLFLSWSSRGHRRSAVPSGRSTWVVVLYALLVHTPATTTVLALNPDWSFAYLLAPGRLQLALLLGTSLLIGALVPLGYLVGTSSLRTAPSGSDRPGLSRLVLAVPLFVLFGINTMFFVKPLTKDATHLAYHNDFGVHSISGSALGYSLMWTAFVLGFALLFTHTLLRRLVQEHRTQLGAEA